MNAKKAIEQLKELIAVAEAYMVGDYEDFYDKDKQALEYAIEVIKTNKEEGDIKMTMTKILGDMGVNIFNGDGSPKTMELILKETIEKLEGREAEKMWYVEKCMPINKQIYFARNDGLQIPNLNITGQVKEEEVEVKNEAKEILKENIEIMRKLLKEKVIEQAAGIKDRSESAVLVSKEIRKCIKMINEIDGHCSKN